jgi:hypothetical protein
VVGEGPVDAEVGAVVGLRLGQPVDHHFGHRHGHRFGQSHRGGTDAVLLEVLNVLGPHPGHHVFDDVVGQLHGLEYENQIILGEIPALTPDGEQLLETVEGDTIGGRP